MMRGRLKNKRACKFSNDKLLAFKAQLDFINSYFSDETISLGSIKEFYEKILQSYSETGVSLLPNIRITEINKGRKNFLGLYEDVSKQIILHEKNITDVLFERKNLLTSVETLMHEFRHFYQLQSIENLAQAKVYKRILGDDYGKIRRDCQIKDFYSDYREINDAFKMLALNGIEYFQHNFPNDSNESNRLIKVVSRGCYLALSTEVDARENAFRSVCDIYSDWAKNVEDEETKVKLKNDFDSYLLKHFSNIENNERYIFYYRKFEDKIKEISHEKMVEMGRKAYNECDEKQDINTQRPAVIFQKIARISYRNYSIVQLKTRLIQSIIQNDLLSSKVLFDLLGMGTKECEKAKENIGKKVNRLVLGENELSYPMLDFLVMETDFLSTESIEKLIIKYVNDGDLEMVARLFSIYYQDIHAYKHESKAFIHKLIDALLDMINALVSSPNFSAQILNKGKQLQLILSIIENDDDAIFKSKKYKNMLDKLEYYLEHRSLKDYENQPYEEENL